MTDSKKKPDLNAAQQLLLKKLPGVDHVLETAKQDPELRNTPRTLLTDSVRQVVDRLRKSILEDHQKMHETDFTDADILKKIKRVVKSAMSLNLTRTINATGIVVHTNLGRSLLAKEALDQIQIISARYSNLEYNLATGKRGLRYTAVEDIVCELTGAEAAMVVNNNAAAVLLCLDTIARHREVVVSRGELVEIGGSFRIPDVMEKSGAILKEVGTTNRTHLKDYKHAINDETGLLLKVHTSNYGIVGFTSAVALKELVELGEQHHLPVMEDLGSGTLIDFSKYSPLREPTVKESVNTGADIVTFSGDKLLGGPQAGIILGNRNVIAKIRQNPLTRALRIDKLTLAALESTLRLYRDEEKAIHAIPTLNMLTASIDEIKKKALKLKELLEQPGDERLSATLIDAGSRAGGGSLPLFELPSKCVGLSISKMTASVIEKTMRENDPPIIGRIEDDIFLMDMRTVAADELTEIANAIQTCLKGS
ncbi:MAG: L-seryl-tRNA(Sec) selenium transferase [Desulfobacteraceae bacterium]|nr:L-seryl-tRNA(Sec) selenium transferase [Desulfobacteraceae bacterium]MBC2754947.1 L-seryl-tRNA(Sec) selenium transferase [Desulfobacteraceae bacterium]